MGICIPDKEVGPDIVKAWRQDMSDALNAKSTELRRLVDQY
jgi:hypothetical protein